MPWLTAAFLPAPPAQTAGLLLQTIAGRRFAAIIAVASNLVFQFLDVCRQPAEHFEKQLDHCGFALPVSFSDLFLAGKVNAFHALIVLGFYDFDNPIMPQVLCLSRYENFMYSTCTYRSLRKLLKQVCLSLA